MLIDRPLWCHLEGPCKLSYVVQLFKKEWSKIGLHLNVSKCEVIVQDQFEPAGSLTEGLSTISPEMWVLLLCLNLAMHSAMHLRQNTLTCISLAASNLTASATILLYSFSVPRLIHILCNNTLWDMTELVLPYSSGNINYCMVLQYSSCFKSTNIGSGYVSDNIVRWYHDITIFCMMLPL